MSLVSTQNSHKRKFDYLVLAAGIIFFLALTGGSLKEYQHYRQGIENIKKTKADVAELQGRKERLGKLLAETKKPEFVENQLREKLGLVKEGESVVVEPTIEPKLVDLRMEEKPVTRKMYWWEWWHLKFRDQNLRYKELVK